MRKVAEVGSSALAHALERCGLGAARAVKAGRFLVVGGVASACYVGAMALAVDGFGTSATLGAVFAFTVGTAVSYIGNTLWAFGGTPDVRVFLRFNVIIFLGLLLNTGIAWALESLGFHYVLISLVILVVVPTWNFVGHDLWTYR